MSKIEITRVGNGIVTFVINDTKNLSVSNLQDLQIEIVGNSNNAVLIQSKKVRQVITLADELIINGAAGPETIEGIFNLLSLEVFNADTSVSGGGSGAADSNLLQTLSDVAGGLNSISTALGRTLKTLMINQSASTAPTDPPTGTNQTNTLAALGTTTFKTQEVIAATGGYPNSHRVHIVLDGVASTVTTSASGDFVAAGKGTVNALVKNSGVVLNWIDAISTVDCYLKIYNIATLPAVGLNTNLQYLWKLKAGERLEKRIPGTKMGTGFAYTITSLGTLTDTTAITGTIDINTNFVS